MDEFQKRFKSFDNSRLIKIIEDAENYHASAVEAARQELSIRNVSEEEIQAVKKEITEKKISNERINEQVQKVGDKAKEIGTEFIETLNPIQEQPQTVDKKIKLIAVVFGILAVFMIYNDFQFLQFVIFDNPAHWNLETALSLLPVVFLSVGVFLFWRRRRWGWYLLTAFCAFQFVTVVSMFYVTWSWQREKNIMRQSSPGDIQVEFHDIGQPFYQDNVLVYAILAIVFGASFWALSRPDIRHAYRIDLRDIIAVIGITLLAMAYIEGLL